MIGARIRRHEDDRLLRGLGRFADDLERAGQVHVRFVRSTVAHARLRHVDTSMASTAPGVVAVVTAGDLADISPIPVRLPLANHPVDPYLQRPLAADKVRYVGEPVAAVAAEDPYLAEDAAELVEVEYEELAPALDAERAIESEASALHGAGNLAATLEVRYGEVEQAFADAAEIVELEADVGRHSAVPLEPRGLLADYDPGTDRLEIWGATKVPQFNRGVLADLLAMPEHRIRMHAMDAGGGFGVRGEFYPEDLVVPWLARRLRRAAKWVEDRTEHLVAVNHSRQQRHRTAAAFDEHGRLLGLRTDILHDNGAYMRTHGLTVPELTVAMLPGPYRVPAYDARIRVVLTNKTPCGTYRAPGRYEGTFVREQLLDVAADRLGIDRVELRRRNLLGPGEMPYARPLRTLDTDLVLDAGDYPALLDAAIDRVRQCGWQEEVRRLRRQGRLAGLGIAMFVEKSGLGPYETAEIVVDGSGAVRVHAGGTSLGQGIETVLAQVAAEQLGVDHTAIEVVAGDTELSPFGLGSWASRSTVVGGSAVRAAAEATAGKAKRVAARMLEASVDDLRMGDGRLSVLGDPAAGVTLGEIAHGCRPGSPYLEGEEEPGLRAARRFEVARMTYPYGVHVAVVEIDHGTGGVRVRRYLVAYEVGRAINPVLVEGQLVGGAAQGIGGALLEELRYDENGQPQATTFMDYLLPTAEELPRVDTLIREDAPSPDNPLGAKGAGEGGVTAAGSALANAVRDALGLAGGVGALPLTPSRVGDLLDRQGWTTSRADPPGHVTLGISNTENYRGDLHDGDVHE